MLRGPNPATTRGPCYPMTGTIGEVLNNACMVPETKTRACKSLLKSCLFLSRLSYILLPSAATSFASHHTRPPNHQSGKRNVFAFPGQNILMLCEILFLTSRLSFPFLLFLPFSFANLFHSSKKLIFYTDLNNWITG